jgi:hypothetical protein
MIACSHAASFSWFLGAATPHDDFAEILALDKRDIGAGIGPSLSADNRRRKGGPMSCLSTPISPAVTVTQPTGTLPAPDSGTGPPTESDHPALPLSSPPPAAPPKPGLHASSSPPPDRPAVERPRRRQTRRRLLQKEVAAPALTAQQRLLLLDAWRRSGLPPGDFASLIGVSQHTRCAGNRKFQEHGLAGLEDQPRGGPTGSRLHEVTRRAILIMYCCWSMQGWTGHETREGFTLAPGNTSTWLSSSAPSL